MAKTHVIIEIFDAILIENVVRTCKMTPYARIEVTSPDCETPTLISETFCRKTSNPVWDFSSTPVEYKNKGEKVMFTVKNEKLSYGRATFGSATVSMEQILSSPKTGDFHELTLLDSKGKSGGVIHARAKPVVITCHDRSIKNAAIDQSHFETPVHRLGVSGGTAPFFNLVLKNPEEGQRPTHFIGKDLAHAKDEYQFYEKINKIRNTSDWEALGGVLKFTFEYAGIIKVPEAYSFEEGKEIERELLVIKNLYDGCKSLRLLDLKIGFITADAGWQGKSWLAAKRQQMLVDNATNSTKQGFRLEGFDGMPRSIKTMDPQIDGHILNVAMSKEKSVKRTRRRAFQNLEGSEIMPFYLDLSHLKLENDQKDEYYHPEEISELVLIESVKRLVELAYECHRTSVPQKWIGSSVALGFDQECLPLRSVNKEEIQENVIVQIFDWGRSQLNTLKDYHKMTISKKKNYRKFWKSYVEGLTYLSWNAAYYYFHRFSNSMSWKEVKITVMDYDGMSENDTIGHVVLPLNDLEISTHPITLRKRPRGTITCSVKWKSYPEESRFKGSWVLFIAHAKDLVNLDTTTLSDPYCKIEAISDNGHRFEQFSFVEPNDLNPVWNSTFEIPLMKDPNNLKDVFHVMGLHNYGCDLSKVFSKFAAKRSSNRLLEKQPLPIKEWEKMLRVGARNSLYYRFSQNPYFASTSSKL